MKKISALTFGLFLAGSLLFTQPAEAKLNSGNYINGDGCLVVWTDHSFLGIHWGYSEYVFCNTNGVPILEP